MYSFLVDSGTGMCHYFNSESNLCSIYELRPLICRINEGYALFFTHMDKQDYILLNTMFCEYLKNIDRA